MIALSTLQYFQKLPLITIDARTVGATIILLVLIGLYRKIQGSGITTKEGRARRHYEYKMASFDKDILELKNLNQKGILNSSEFEDKLAEINNDKENFQIEYYLELNAKYKSVLDAFKKGYITTEQKSQKIIEIREQIEKNVRKRK